MRYLRSAEDKEQVAAIRENCISKIDSVLNDERMTVANLQEFDKRLDELVQDVLGKVTKSLHAIPDEYNDTICILRGKSPRGDFGHVVVAKYVDGGAFEMVHDPHPCGNFLDKAESYGWCLFFA